MIAAIQKCRICGSENLQPVLNLGEQALTGVFPASADVEILKGPLELVRCTGFDACGLVQLRCSYGSSELYGEHYGYRSGLNRSMVEHLRDTHRYLNSLVDVLPGDVVLDIGSNDGTLLQFFAPGTASLVGIDPSAGKFAKYYRPDVRLIVDFFSADRFRSASSTKAKIITSIAMFYDLPDPLGFMKQIAEVLHDEGVWHFEQSYMPTMLAMTAYDTICHEHVEYYSLRQIVWMTRRAKLKIINLARNDVNGGSFAVTVAHESSKRSSADAAVEEMLAEENMLRLDTPAPYEDFARRVAGHRDALREMLDLLKRDGRSVLGYGASTKGNVILQYCGITREQLPAIAEVNEDKFGHVTPGTKIPIISEREAHERKPDYLLVFPWHFRANLIERESTYLNDGGKMIFPLPRLEIVAK